MAWVSTESGSKAATGVTLVLGFTDMPRIGAAVATRLGVFRGDFDFPSRPSDEAVCVEVIRRLAGRRQIGCVDQAAVALKLSAELLPGVVAGDA
jgi:hypothetical protein